ncbi:MAG: hypothetical protein H0X16_02715 [Chloroflexi bacterium]|nr:hypothetical protein [Chloroflexota bacterium]
MPHRRRGGTNDGARPTCLVADKLYEWTGGKERVHLIASNGLSKRRDTLELNITTAGSDPDTLLGRLFAYGRKLEAGEIRDDNFLFAWRAASDERDLDDAAQLRAAVREATRDRGRLPRRGPPRRPLRGDPEVRVRALPPQPLGRRRRGVRSGRDVGGRRGFRT